jgi:hypothetical protein
MNIGVKFSRKPDLNTRKSRDSDNRNSFIEAPMKPMAPMKPSTSRSKVITLLAILIYCLYLLLIILSQIPYIAENFTESKIPDNVEYHLTFHEDGKQSHYEIIRSNNSFPGRIDIYYYSQTNKLNVNLQNIEELTIDCRSMYYDECNDVFGFDPYQEENSNYYKWYFIEKDHLTIDIISDSALEVLQFEDVPKPEKVLVDHKEMSEGQGYEYNANRGIGLSNITSGTHQVDIYFKPSSTKPPVAIIEPIKSKVLVNERILLNGTKSYDPTPEGGIINYLWDYGDGNFTTGKGVVTYSYSVPGNFGIILTVVNKDTHLGFAFLNITVVASTDLCIIDRIPNLNIPEDSGAHELELQKYEPPFKDDEDCHWYITGEDMSLISIEGENSSDDTIFITPLPDQVGSNLVEIWLVDDTLNSVCQELWINISPVNDPPTIFGIPDITIHYDIPYEFNYLPYITDIDTKSNDLILNSSDQTHTFVDKLNVTYKYPKSMVGKIEYVILTIWDGQYESSDVVAVWITDDWVPNLVKPLPDVNLKEGEIRKNYFDLDDYFMDPDNDTLYYSYGYTHVNVVINPDHTVDFYAPNNWYGEEMTTFRATDPSGALVEDIITVTVLGVNDPPVINHVPNLVVRYQRDYIFDVSPYIYDEDDSLEKITLTTSEPDHIRISEIDHLTIILNYPYRQDIPYTDTVTLTVSDGSASDFQIITVFVKDNYPPISKKPFPVLNLYEDRAEYNVLNLYDYFDDNDSTILYFTALHPELLNVNIKIKLNSSIDIIPQANWSGFETITIRAQDPDTAFHEKKLVVKVLPLNDPPVIKEIPTQRFNISEKYKLDLYPYLYDVDNNITSLVLRLKDCEIDYEIVGTKIIFYPTKAIRSTFTLYVSDGNTEVTQKVLIIVSAKTAPSSDLYFDLLVIFIIITLIMVLGISGTIMGKYFGNFVVNELFLIYKNGCLILHQSNEDFNRTDADVDIISAMFTAVQDFTRDSFANVKENGESEDENWKLKKLEFQNNNIILERGEFVYLAVVFTGRLGRKLKNDLKELRMEIETKYADVLTKWDGDLDPLEGIDDVIKKYMLI